MYVLQIAIILTNILLMQLSEAAVPGRPHLRMKNDY